MSEPSVVRDYFAAMRHGAAAAEDLFRLFTADAVYVEPFTGLGPAVGIDEIRSRFEMMWQTPLPDLELDIRSVTVHGNEASSRWECRSPALSGPQTGEDRYVLRDGRIARLEVQLTSADAGDSPDGDHSA